MNDYDSAAWAEHHSRWSDDAAALFGRLFAGFERLQAIAYGAPWKHAARRPRAPVR